MTARHRSGRHFLQIPGPTNVPDRILRAMDRPTIDHRGPEFAKLAAGILEDLKPVFRTAGPVVIYPSSGTGAWEAALVNTLSPGDSVLMAETGHFATLWCEMARRLGLEVELLPGDWRHGVDPEQIGAQPRRRSQASDQGGVRGAQRDLDRGHLARRRGAQGDRPGRPSGAVHGRHHLVARLDRLPARRVGRRRHRRRLAEGSDAAARPRFQCARREGAGRRQERPPAEVLLGLAGDAERECQGRVSLYARDQPALRPARGAFDAAGAGARAGVRAPCAPRRGDAPGGPRLGPRAVVPGSARVLELADRGPGA